ncbi:MAG: DUF2878 family protein [Proteobacteria bacterium]|nr:DUF2878 family protein [Pseudomonadota bacterium]
MSARFSLLLNAALFQAGWWACVVSAAQQRAVQAALALAGVVAIQILLHAAPLRALWLALACLALGAVIETLLVALHVTAYPHAELVLGLAPAWMAGLWALLSTTLDASLRWLQGRRVLGIALGAGAGALSYAAGARLGALVLPGAHALWVIAAVWGLALPLLFELARWLERARWPR